MDWQNIRIETSQNVAIDYETANLGDRLLAWMIDIGLLIAYQLFAFAMLRLEPLGSTTMFVTLVLVPLFFYDLIFEVLMNGQTPGKAVRKIKVARLDGSQPGLGDYLLRWVLRPIEIGLTLGSAAMIAILWNGTGQRLGDLAAGTTVIKVRQRFSLEETLLTDIAEDYQVRFPEVEQLTNGDIELIKEVTLSLDLVENQKLYRSICRRSREALRERLGLPEVELSDTDFLNTILKDYAALHRSQAHL